MTSVDLALAERLAYSPHPMQQQQQQQRDHHHQQLVERPPASARQLAAAKHETDMLNKLLAKEVWRVCVCVCVRV